MASMCLFTSDRPLNVLTHSGHLWLSVPWWRSLCSLKARIVLKLLGHARQVRLTGSNMHSSKTYLRGAGEPETTGWAAAISAGCCTRPATFTGTGVAPMLMF